MSTLQHQHCDLQPPALGDLGPQELETFLGAIVARYGDRIVYSTHSSEHAPPLPEPFTQRPGKTPNPSYEGVSRMDHLMDVVTKMLAHPPDYALPEFAVGEPDPMTDNWVQSVLYNANRQAARDYRLHQHILSEAEKDPGSWLAQRPGRSAEAEALAAMEYQECVAAIMRLPRKLRGVAILYFDGHSMTETAAILGVGRTTVWRRLEEIRSPRIRAMLGL
jgi:DNA-directed RNA polymerase specialized sigma24 family protein